MAVLSITIPDAAVSCCEDAVAAKFGWTVADGTKAAFLLVQMRAWLKDIAVNAEVAEAATAAADTARSDTETLIS